MPSSEMKISDNSGGGLYQTVLLTLNTVGFPKMIMTYNWIRELLERLENEEH